MQTITRSGAAESGVSDEVSGAWTRSASSPAECAASLRRTIEAEIIPRLMLAHRVPSNDALVPGELRADIGPQEVEVLTELVLRADSAGAQAYVQGRRKAGLSVEKLYLELLSSVALRLGVMWENDECDFTQVTVGLWRLQQLVFEYSDAFQRDRRLRATTHRVMLAPAPGSQHTFGVVMVGEFFRRAGWDVRGDPSAGPAEIRKKIAASSFDVLGLSVGTECHIPAISSAILKLRKASRNRSMVVMVGGPAVLAMPDFVARVGADGTAKDAATAVTEAELLVSRRQGAD